VYDVERVEVLDGVDELREQALGPVVWQSTTQLDVLQQIAVPSHLHHHHDLHSRANSAAHPHTRTPA